MWAHTTSGCIYLFISLLLHRVRKNLSLQVAILCGDIYTFLSVQNINECKKKFTYTNHKKNLNGKWNDGAPPSITQKQQCAMQPLMEGLAHQERRKGSVESELIPLPHFWFQCWTSLQESLADRMQNLHQPSPSWPPSHFQGQAGVLQPSSHGGVSCCHSQQQDMVSSVLLSCLYVHCICGLLLVLQ